MKPIDPALGAAPAYLQGTPPTPVSVFTDPNLPVGTRVIVSRWQPSAAERELITNGGDVFVAQLIEAEEVQTLAVFGDPTDFISEKDAPKEKEEEVTVAVETVPTDSEGAE